MNNMEQPKLNSDKISKIQNTIVKRYGKYGRKASQSDKIWTIWKKGKLNIEKIWKIQKKIVKCYGKYGRKVG